MRYLTLKIAEKTYKLKPDQLSMKTVGQLVTDLAEEPKGPLVLSVADVHDWPEESQRALWGLWRTVEPNRTVKLRLDGVLHATPLDAVLAQLVSDANPGRCGQAVRTAAIAVSSYYGEPEQAVCHGKILDCLTRLGVRG